ncbi:MAG: hypothetical protein II937_09920 [Bacteroidales bacterium]|nr:hypothetical protein [Bacteroidales bacterium]
MTALQSIIERIKNFHIANMTLRKWKLNYTRVRREFWQTIATLAVLIFILYFVSGSTNSHATDNDFIEEACREYESKTGRKIYPKGRECIRTAAITQGLRTADDVSKLISDNAKFMWKDQLVPTTITIEKK